MELHQLRYFVAVARTGSFTRAARQCHVSQPSLSQQIRKLEDELGERLFERLPRAVVLTGAGQRLLDHASRVLDEIAQAEQTVRDARRNVEGRIRLGVLPTIAPYLLPEVLRSFRKRYPGVDFLIEEDVTPHLSERLQSSELDLALWTRPVPVGALTTRDLYSERLWLACPRGHALASRSAIPIDELEARTFILLHPVHCLGEQVLHFCQSRQVHPCVTFRASQLETVMAMVASGLGVSLIPEMARRFRRPRTPLFRRVAPPEPFRTIAVSWRSHRVLSRPEELFLDHLEKHLPECQSQPRR